jgi:HSP20 family protein
MRYLTPFRFGRSNNLAKTGEHPAAAFQRALNSLFDDFFKGFEVSPFDEIAGSFNPRIDMTEDEKEIRVTAELPGLEEKDIEVNFSKDILTIRGEKTQEKEEKGKESYYSERSYGSFTRAIQIPSGVDDGKIDATFKKGVLSIMLPKLSKPVEQQKKIQIKAA